MKRIFLGIDLPHELKNKIEKLKNEYQLKNLPIKLVEPENSHIAFKFLADLTDEQIARVAETVSRAVGNFKCFNVSISGCLAFPNFEHARVLALKVVSPNLNGLATKLFSRFNELDFIEPEQRPYAPHVTLGRIKDTLTLSQQQKISQLKFGAEFLVDRLQLFHNQLTADGPAYAVLKNFQLK